MLTDSAGKAIAGRDINWATSLGMLSAASGQTGQDGTAVVTLTSRSAGNTSVTASSGNDSWVSDTVIFEQAEGNYTLTQDKTLATANGTDTITFTVVATHYDGKPMNGEQVTWTTDAGTLSQTSTTTDASGQTTVTLSNSAAGTSSARRRKCAHAGACVEEEELLRTNKVCG